MEIPKEIKDIVKNTIGYSEAKDKESFLVGSQVAFAKSEEFYINKIKQLTDSLNYYKSAHETTQKDITTIVKIFNKYQD